MVLHLPLQFGILAAQTLHGQGPLQRGQQGVQPYGLEHIVDGSGSHRLDGSRNRSVPRHDDGDKGRIDRDRVLKKRKAVHLRHDQVCQDQVEGAVLQGGKGFRPGCNRGHAVSLVPQGVAQRGHQRNFVVYDEKAAVLTVCHVRT